MGCRHSFAPPKPSPCDHPLSTDPICAVSPNGHFKEHLTKVNDLSEFEKKYTWGKKLGQGITGQVNLVTNKLDGQVYACKSLNVDQMDPQQIYELRAEIQIVRVLDHPAIISLMEVYQGPKNIYIIMEHCSGLDLGHRTFKNEEDVRHVVFQLTEAIAYCHQMGVVHRDIKLENIMFSSADSNQLRLIDFGLSKHFLSTAEILTGDKLMQKRHMSTACGTAFYMAPEMLKSSYSEKADTWAIGITAYMVLTGHAPFEGEDEKMVFAKIKKGLVNYNASVWKTSPLALDFVKSLLCVDPEKRLSAKEALNHPWLQMSKTLVALPQKMAQSVCDSILRFASYSKLKRLALMAVAHHLKEKDTRELRDLFMSIDDDHSGLLSFEDIYNHLMSVSGLELEREYFRSVFNRMDTEKEGNVHCSEFLAAALESRVTLTEELLNQAFDDFLQDASGRITAANLQAMMGGSCSSSKAKWMLSSCKEECGLPCTQEGLTREEFLILMLHSTRAPTPLPQSEEDSTSSGEEPFPSQPLMRLAASSFEDTSSPCQHVLQQQQQSLPAPVLTLS